LERDRVEEVVAEAIDFYNRFRKPEAEAVLLEITDTGSGSVMVKVLFRGSFCRTCGIRDWVEDFKYILLSMGVENELVEYIEPEDDEYVRIGVFEIKSTGGEGDGG